MKRRLFFLCFVFVFAFIIVGCNNEPKIPQGSFILDADNGTPSITLKGDVGTIASLPIPTKEGFTFLGWFDDSNNKYEEKATYRDSIVNLQAHWNTSISLTGRISIPENSDFVFSDFWIKSTNGIISQVLPDGSFALSGFEVGQVYDLYFSCSEPSSAITKAKSITPILRLGALKSDVRVLSGETIDLGVVPMRPTGTITGSVTMQGAESEENGGIEVYIPGTWFVATTTDNGSYTLEDVPEGHYTVKFNKQGYLDKQIDDILIVSGDSFSTPIVNLDSLVLAKRESGVFGVVRLEGMSDYSGVRVAIPGTSYETVTNKEGEYLIAAEAGTYPMGLVISAVDYSTEIYGSSLTVSEDTPLTISTIELKALNARSVCGVVKLKNVEDCSGISVKLKNTNSEYEAITDESGKWMMEHIPLGAYELKINVTNVPELTSHVLVSAGINDYGVYTLVPNGSTITGFVSLSGMNSADNVNVRVQNTTTMESFSISTKADGLYSFSNIDPSFNYQITFTKDGWGSTSVEVTDLAAYEIREIACVEMVDSINPIISRLQINNGENTTVSRDVVVHVDATDNGSGIANVALSYNSDFTSFIFSGAFRDSIEIELPVGNSVRTIYCRVFDLAGNYSSAEVSIKLAAEKYEITGILSGEELHWTMENSPYLVMGNIAVPAGETLTIDPGVDVQFNGNYFIQVEGTLNAIGAENNPIAFYSVNPSVAWGGIVFTSSVVTNGTKYVPEYTSGNIIKNASMRGGMYTISGRPWIESCDIEGSTYALGTSGKAFTGYAIDCTIRGKLYTTSASLVGCDLYVSDIDTNAFGDSDGYLVSCKLQPISTGRITIDSGIGHMVNCYSERINYYQSWVDYSFSEIVSSTLKDCTIQCSYGGSPEFSGNEFCNVSLIINADSSTGTKVNFCNFDDSSSITVTKKSPSVAFDFKNCFWGESHSSEIASNGTTGNLSFITDYYDDFTNSKIDYSDNLSEPVPFAGYNENGFMAISATRGYSFFEVANDHSVEGYIGVSPSVRFGKTPSKYRVSTNLEWLLDESNLELGWDYDSDSIKYTIQKDEMTETTLYVQAKDKDVYSQVSSFTVSGDIATGLNMLVMGPAEGFICYSNPNYEEDGWRYLEASPNNLCYNTTDQKYYAGTEAGAYSGTTNFYFGVLRNSSNQNCFTNGTTTFDSSNCTGTAIGTGKANTEALVNAMGETAYVSTTASNSMTTSFYAAKAVTSLTCNGFSDWFLPSISEMSAIKTAFSRLGLSNVFSSPHWTSSEHSTSVNYAYTSSGSSYSKARTYAVRPARTF